MAKLADATAAPAMLSIGALWWRKDLLISPLSVRDLGWYDRLGGHGATLNITDSIMLIWISLRKHQPSLTWSRCRRWFMRRFGIGQRRLGAAMVHILDINPGCFKQSQADGSGGSNQPDNAHIVLMRALARMFRWGPDITFGLTVEQANLYLVGDLDKSVDKVRFSTREEAEAYIAERNKANETGELNG